MTKYSEWIRYFQSNQWEIAQFPFHNSPQLAPRELQLIAASLQQFQLGEGSDGNGLLRRAEEFGRREDHPDLARAMLVFIREEQRHSAVLGKFLDQEGIPRLHGHWVDRWFRWLRGLAGFELMVSILVSAECIAVPYYQAIHDATNHTTLRLVCRRILQDEAQHLEFQADNIAICAERRGWMGRTLTIVLHIVGLTLACALVFLLHRRLFHAVGMHALRFWGLAMEAYGPIFRRMAQLKSAVRASGLALSH